jgi:hypothetical protein
VIFHYSLGIYEKAAENGILSTTPQTREPRRFKLVWRQAWTVFEPPQRMLVPDILPPFPSNPKKLSYRGPIFGPRPLTPEMDFSRSLAGHGS